MPDSNSVAQNRLAFEAEMANRLSKVLIESTGGREVGRSVKVPIAADGQLDLLLEIEANGRRLHVAVKTLRQAYPRDVREAVWSLEAYGAGAKAKDLDLVCLVAAEHISAGAKELLRNRKVGYFDLAGNLFIQSGSWLIHIERPTPRATRSDEISLFTEARAGVLHALLKNRNDNLTGSELAALSQTSDFTCSVVLKELERREWVTSTGSGYNLRRRLVESAALLDAWADAWADRKDEPTRWHLFASSQDDLLARLATHLNASESPWAISGTAAANAMAPLLTSVETVQIIVPKGTTLELVDRMRLKPADKGWNVSLSERNSASLLFREQLPVGPAWFASPFIVYLDLLDGRGRNKELAEHLRRTVLKT